MSPQSVDVIDSFTGEYRFLSNFSPHPVDYVNVRWPTLEHAFQAAKCVDPAQRLVIAAARTPGHAKRLGRTVCRVPGWNLVRVNVMSELLRSKFTLSPSIRDALLATGRAQLVEGNRWCDQFWGDCRCGRPGCAEPGTNTLGKQLMLLRAQLRLGAELGEGRE